MNISNLIYPYLCFSYLSDINISSGSTYVMIEVHEFYAILIVTNSQWLKLDLIKLS